MSSTAPANLTDLQSRLAEPDDNVVDALKRIDGDILILGVGGKMGPSLAVMAKRASTLAGNTRRVIGVSRFSNALEARQLQLAGVETVACDLLDRGGIARLPEAANVIFMPGFKFGFDENPSRGWAVNAHVPALICEKFARSRIIVFSTGSLYGLTPVADGGARECEQSLSPGEYAASCLGRERIFEYFSRRDGIPMVTVRLFYACEMRYGVLVDIATKVLKREPVDLTMGWFNVIWQGSSHACTLRLFQHASAPPLLVNLTGPEMLSTRAVATRMGELMGVAPLFCGSEAPTACLGNVDKVVKLVGRPRVSAETLIEWVAAWVARGGENLGKPTHFEVRDGRY